MLYRTRVQLYFDYCNIIWATQNNYHLITSSQANDNFMAGKLLFKKYDILTIFHSNKFQIWGFAYKAVNNQLLDRFSNLISLNSDIIPIYVAMIFDSVSSYI